MIGANFLNSVRSDKDHKNATSLLLSIRKAVADALFNLLQYSPFDENQPHLLENFSPVDEIGDKVLLQAISGEVPADFPEGAYIRAGPNPQYGAHSFKSKLGGARQHWFEGDGMLHAVYFEKINDKYELCYKNKYVETAGKSNVTDRKQVVLPTFEGTPLLLAVNALINKLRFGFLIKPTSNTSVWCHGGRLFAAADYNLPHEIDFTDLCTVGELDFKGAWKHDNFTAHPKIDPSSHQMIFQGYSVLKKPHVTVGFISEDGETLLHRVDVGLERPGLNHTIMITERFTVIMDFPFVFDTVGLLLGKSPLKFDHGTFSRFGIFPRFGDSKSIRWFQVETNCVFHTFNAYEVGSEVVVYGLRATACFLDIDYTRDQTKLFRRGITSESCVVGESGFDPLIDGALLPHLHEWRFDLEKGTVTERDLNHNENYVPLELPTINNMFTGRINRYGYTGCMDQDKSHTIGLPVIGNICKVDFSTLHSTKNSVETEIHDFGPSRYGGEPCFVPRPGGTKEDDGWIVLYVYDEITDSSELVIIDAQRFTEKPVARFLLPQRVPYGFHGTFVSTSSLRSS